MQPGENFEQRRPTYQARIEKALEDCLPAAAITPRRLHGAMRDAVLRGGKRLRPLLCYAAAEATGVPVSRVDAPAIAVELIHSYSLVHDDMPCMDDDDFRRGKPSIHRIYGEDAALLVGDALQTLAWQVLATHPSLEGRDGARVRLIALFTECARLLRYGRRTGSGPARRRTAGRRRTGACLSHQDRGIVSGGDPGGDLCAPRSAHRNETIAGAVRATRWGWPFRSEMTLTTWGRILARMKTAVSAGCPHGFNDSARKPPGPD